MKRCPDCGETDITQFSKKKVANDGFQNLINNTDVRVTEND